MNGIVNDRLQVLDGDGVIPLVEKLHLPVYIFNVPALVENAADAVVSAVLKNCYTCCTGRPAPRPLVQLQDHPTVALSNVISGSHGW